MKNEQRQKHNTATNGTGRYQSDNYPVNRKGPTNRTGSTEQDPEKEQEDIIKL